MATQSPQLICDFNDGTRCKQEADNVGIDEETQECLAVVCEQHACCLADDFPQLVWFTR